MATDSVNWAYMNIDGIFKGLELCKNKLYCQRLVDTCPGHDQTFGSKQL